MVYSERIAKWDNAKLLLIFLVVLGHFLETFLAQYPVCESMYGMIYLFHMPAFLFISGMFSKKTIDADRLDWAKITPYLILFVLLDFGRFIVRYQYDPTLTFRIFRITGVSWYLFALFVLIVVTHFLRKIDPKYVFCVAIGIALIIGYSKGIGYWFALYRIITMFPFFYLGYLWNREKVEWALGRPWVKILAVAVLILHIFGCLSNPGKVLFWEPVLTAGTNYYAIDFEVTPYPWLQNALQYEASPGTVSDEMLDSAFADAGWEAAWRDELLEGRTLESGLADDVSEDEYLQGTWNGDLADGAQEGSLANALAQAELDAASAEEPVVYKVPPTAVLLRLGYYGMAFIVMFAVLSLIPKRRIPVLSKMGSRTLSVYFWHLMIVEILVHQKWLLEIVGRGGVQTIILLVILSTILTGLLATKPCMVPLDWLMRPMRRTQSD